MYEMILIRRCIKLYLYHLFFLKMVILFCITIFCLNYEQLVYYCDIIYPTDYVCLSD